MSADETKSTIAIRARPQDAEPIISLAARVQAAITASGSLQVMGSLDLKYVEDSISDGRCYVLLSSISQNLDIQNARLIGCALYRPITKAYYAQTPDFSMLNFADPHFFLHSVMVEPELRGNGRGLGLELMSEFVKHIDGRHSKGTIFLDCWAGNHKLRDFYTRLGLFTYAADVPEEDYHSAVFYRSCEGANVADGEGKLEENQEAVRTQT